MNLRFAQLGCFAPPAPAPQHETAPDFRKYLLTHPATSSKRVLRIPLPHRLAATPQGGDCFFHALQWSLPSTPPPQSLREALSTHVRKESTFYSSALLARGLVGDITDARAAVTVFTEQVLKPGMHGHWLGSLWGELEILAVARAFGVCIELFTFDVHKQTLRLYFDVREGKTVVRMLFTGRADAGHFDALLPEPRLKLPSLKMQRRKKEHV